MRSTLLQNFLNAGPVETAVRRAGVGVGQEPIAPIDGPRPVIERGAHASPEAPRSCLADGPPSPLERSEEHTSELQSLMRISYAVFCLKKKKKEIQTTILNVHLEQ